MRNKRIGNYRVLDQRINLYAAEDIIVNEEVVYKEGELIKRFILKKGIMKCTSLPLGKYFIQYCPYEKIALVTVQRS